MKKLLIQAALVAMSLGAVAQTPAILLEACNAMEPPTKRLECLRAANGVQSGQANAYSGASVRPQAAYAMPSVAPSRYAPTPTAPPRTSGGPTCYTGPRGGTYTITASGRKNYSGC